MEIDQIERLKKRYDFGAWCGKTTLPENLFVFGYRQTGTELADWVGQVEGPVRLPDTPPFTQGVWHRRDSPSDDDDALRIDVYECASRTAAHEFLIRMLGEFQQPVVERLREPSLGDVVFSVPGGAMVLAARANLVLHVMNVGRTIVPAADIALALDQAVCAKPGDGEPEGVGQRHRVRIPHRRLTRSKAIPVDVETAPGRRRADHAEDEAPPTLRFFSRSGEVELKDGRPVYRAAQAGPQALTVIATDAAGETAQSRVDFQVDD